MESVKEVQVNGGSLKIDDSYDKNEDPIYVIWFIPIGKDEDDAAFIYESDSLEQAKGVVDFFVKNMSFQSMLTMGIGR